MSTEDQNNSFKIALGIVVALLLGVSALFFLKNNELNDTKKTLNAEIESVTTDLESLRSEYDKQIEENEILNKDLIAERDRLALTIDSLRSAQADVATLLRYKNQYFRLKKEKDRLFEENQRLLVENNALALENGALLSQNEKGEQKIDSLQTEISGKDKMLELGSEISVAGLKGLAIIERSSGKQIVTTKAKRANKIKICFAVAANKIAAAGDKELFIQVLDANNNVIGANATKQFSGKTLNYSASANFNYNNKAVDVCEYITEPKDGFGKGNYFVNVFEGERLVATESFSLE